MTTRGVGRVDVCTSSQGLALGKGAVSQEGVRSYPAGSAEAVVASEDLIRFVTAATTVASISLHERA